MTLLIVAACIAVFVFWQPSAVRNIGSSTQAEIVEEMWFNYQHAVVPCELTQFRPLSALEIAATATLGLTDACIDGPVEAAVFGDKNLWLAIPISMFLHGGWLHLIGNLVFLWVFGRIVEDHTGAARFVLLYAASGVVATIAHIVALHDSTVPVIGASGAVAGVMGIVLAWFPLTRLRVLIMVGVIPILSRLPAAVLLVIWFGSQFFIGNDSDVAWVAHVAGFLFGFVTGLLTRRGLHSRARPAETIYLAD